MLHHWYSRLGFLGLTAALPLLLPSTSTAQGRTTITPFGNVYRAGGRAPLGGFYSPYRANRTTLTPFGNVYYAGPRFANRFAYYPSFGLGYGGYYPAYGYPLSYAYGYYPTFGLYPSLFAGSGCLPNYGGAAPFTLGLSSYGFSSPLFVGGTAAPAVETGDLAPEVTTAPPSGNPTIARVDLHVPDNAEVWIEGVKMKQTGPLRRFVSPPLRPGQQYQYHVRVTWSENGKPVTRTQTIPIEAGDTSSLAFLPSVTAPSAVAAGVPADR